MNPQAGKGAQVSDEPNQPPRKSNDDPIPRREAAELARRIAKDIRLIMYFVDRERQVPLQTANDVYRSVPAASGALALWAVAVDKLADQADREYDEENG